MNYSIIAGKNIPIIYVLFLVEDGIDRVITLTDFICLELTETGKVTILKK